MTGTTEKVINQKGKFLGSLTKFGLPLMKNVLTPLAKNVFLPLTVKAAASAADATIQKKLYGSDVTTLITPNQEMKDILDIVEYPEESG